MEHPYQSSTHTRNGKALSFIMGQIKNVAVEL